MYAFISFNTFSSSKLLQEYINQGSCLQATNTSLYDIYDTSLYDKSGVWGGILGN